MFYSEIYGAYYNTVAAVLKIAVNRPVSNSDIYELVERYAFGESVTSIPDNLTSGKWQLLDRGKRAIIKNAPTMPLTILQKRWLKSVFLDPRIQLFDFDMPVLDDVEPLFLPEDYIIFDKYLDGDDYRNPQYIRNFKFIFNAIISKSPISVVRYSRSGRQIKTTTMPKYLEYSEKDDKFRLIGTGTTINLARIISVDFYDGDKKFEDIKFGPIRPEKVIFELIDERKALNRVLLHFAHFKKEVEKIGDNKYKVTLFYDKDDETEIVIRILSFGPHIKVLAPNNFIQLIRERLKKQRSCEC